MKCPSCGSENAAGTKFCILCGAKIPLEASQQPSYAQQPVHTTQPSGAYQNSAPQYPQQPPKEPVYKQSWFVVLMLILFWPVGLVLMWVHKKTWLLPVKIIITAFFALSFLLFAIGGSGSSDTGDDTSMIAATTTEAATEAEESKEEQTEEATEAPTEESTKAPTEAETEAPTEAQPTVDIIKEGTYKVGTDLPAGEYCIFSMSEYGGYYSVNADSKGDSIIGNGNIDYNAFVTVSDGQYLEMSRAMAIPAEQIAGSMYEIMTDGEGMFRAGIDLPAGEYKLQSTDDDIDAYYCVYDSSTPDAPIVTNDNFSGQTYITVSEGQYLVLNRCKISE